MGKKFSGRLVEFELPPGWDCKLDRGDWICQSADSSRQQEAIIIVASKQRGAQDSLKHYREHLQQGRSYRVSNGARITVSLPRYVQSRSIAGHIWIDALQLAGQVPGFYTRYMASVKRGNGLAVTFTVARDKYPQYKEVFDGVASSLRTFEVSEHAHGTESAGPGTEVLDLPRLAPFRPETRAQKRAHTHAAAFGEIGRFLLFALGIVALIIARKRRKQKVPPPQNPPASPKILALPKRSQKQAEEEDEFFDINLELEWERIEKAEKVGQRAQSKKKRKAS